MTELRDYLASDGQSPFVNWSSALDTAAAAKVSVALARLEQGNLSNAKGVGKGAQAMALTRSFKELVQSRIARDPDFAAALLCEGIDTMLTGDVDTGKAILRDYIKATVGFEKLGEATGTPAKSLIRMFGPRGNPQARNLFGVIGYLQQQASVELHVMPGPRGSARLAA